MSRPDHPGPLTIALHRAEIYARITVDTQDPHELRIDIKGIDNVDQVLARTVERVLARPVAVHHLLPDHPQLWVGRTAINLAPHQVQPAAAWCQRYLDWLREGDLNLTAPRAQQAAA